MDSITVIGLVSSVASIILVAVLVIAGFQSWMEATFNAQTELDTLVAEVTSTRAALGPLERYVRLRSPDERSQKVILTMMADLRVLEDQLFEGIENYLGTKSLTFESRLIWIFKRAALKEIAGRISTQKITILALQVAELTQQTVTLVQNSASQELALTEFLQTNPIPNPNASVRSLAMDENDGETNTRRRAGAAVQNGGAGEGNDVQYGYEGRGQKSGDYKA